MSVPRKSLEANPELGDLIVWRFPKDMCWRIGEIKLFLGGRRIIIVEDCTSFHEDVVALEDIDWYPK